MPNLSFEGSTEEGWVCKMAWPIQQGPGVATVFEGPRRHTTEDAMWDLIDAITMEAAEYREVKKLLPVEAVTVEIPQPWLGPGPQ